MQLVEASKPIRLYQKEPEKVTQFTLALPPEEKESLKSLLIECWDIFYWAMADMLGIHSSIIQHSLGVDPSTQLVKHKKRKFFDEKVATTREEVKKLLAAGFIREVTDVDCVSNAVMVPESGNMC